MFSFKKIFLKENDLLKREIVYLQGRVGWLEKRLVDGYEDYRYEDVGGFEVRKDFHVRSAIQEIKDLKAVVAEVVDYVYREED